MKNKLHKMVLIVGALVLIIYTVIIMQRHGFNIDELDWTLRLIDGKSWGELFKELASYGYNLPLFYVIVKWMNGAFHQNKFMLLLPSAIMTVIGCYYIYKTSKEFFKVKFPLLTFFMVLSSAFFFKQIACSLRPYGLLFMLSAMSYYYYFKKLYEDKFSYHVKFIMVVIGLLFTHWYGALVVLGYGMTDFYFLMKKKMKFRNFCLYIIPFTLILLWVIYVFKMHTITFTKYWADPVGILAIIMLLFELLSLNLFSIIILKIVLKHYKVKIERVENDIKARVTLYEILGIALGVILYSNIINPKSSLWVNRYFIAFMPQIAIIVSFYLEKFYCLLSDEKVDEVNRYFMKLLVIINLFSSIIFTGYYSYLYPNISSEMAYDKIFEELKKDKDIYEDNTLIICTYGKYWVKYHLFENNEKLPSNLLIIDPHKYGNTNSEDAKLSELEYIIKDSKECHEKFDDKEEIHYQKIYIMELHRMLVDEEAEKIINLDDYKIDYDIDTSIVTLVRNED
ncbi:MAG: glycosyltransferase family 39 protein [Clostridia bacterium]|nr:glycosyltransferase family 39 protein [Clostridia bacterium]